MPRADHQHGGFGEFFPAIPLRESGTIARKTIGTHQKRQFHLCVSASTQGFQCLSSKVGTVTLPYQLTLQVANSHFFHNSSERLFNLISCQLADCKTMFIGQAQRAFDAFADVVVPENRHQNNLRHFETARRQRLDRINDQLYVSFMQRIGGSSKYQHELFFHCLPSFVCSDFSICSSCSSHNAGLASAGMRQPEPAERLKLNRRGPSGAAVRLN